MSSPPPKSLVPAPTTMPTVWPPSNPSGTVIPFPLPWGQTGCCPPGGMDALMKCYCDLQQASAFIGQVMLDQINNNPAITAAIIAAIEASGSSLPTLGVTNGSNAQPGQVGEWVQLTAGVPYPTGNSAPAGFANVGVLPPGDWDCYAYMETSDPMTAASFALNPIPVGFSNFMNGFIDAGSSTNAWGVIISPIARASTTVPSLVVFEVNTYGATVAGTANILFAARRAR